MVMRWFLVPNPEPNPKPQPKAEPDRGPTEEEQVFAWQFIQLLDLGFSTQDAEILVGLPGFSWHDADDLISKGMTHDEVFDQLT